jgi:hypothetical protein
MAISLLALPVANAQTLIMNVSGPVLLHSEVDIDLNGPDYFIENVTLWIKYPGRADFTYIGGYPTTTSGDLDVYDFDFNETGDYELKWALPPDFTVESNVVIIEAITVDMLPPWTTYAYIGATPNPVGVGQETLLHVGITTALTNVRYGWDDLTVEVTRPDGHTETLGPFRTDATGGTGTIYVPTMAGNYTLQTHFPEQRTDEDSQGGGVVQGTLMLASDSEKLRLVVQEEPVPYHQGFPLPTEYWTRPISAEFREWNAIAGNFLASVRYDAPLVPYSKMPDTPHILWGKPLELGGLAGGIEYGPQSYDHGDAYEGRFVGSVVINGVLYYNKFYSGGGSRVEQIVVAVDLHTGEVLWERPLVDGEGNADRLDFGQVFYWDSYNQHSCYAYLWTTSGSNWNAFDPFTGRWMYSMDHVPSGTNLYGEKGEIYRYNIDLADGEVSLWNSSRVISTDGSWISGGLGRTYDARDGIEWTQPIAGMTGERPFWGSVEEVFLFDRVIGVNMISEAEYRGAGVGVTSVNTWAFSLKPGQEGTLLYNTTWNVPPEWATGSIELSFADADVDAGVFTLWAKETRQHVGFDIDSGNYLWTTDSEHYLNIFGVRIRLRLGRLYSTGFSGELYAYDVTTGDLDWEYKMADPLNEILWGANWPPLFAFFTGDGKILMFHMEHSPVDPMPRGAPTVVLDAETGDVVWRMDGLRGNRWGGNTMVIGDGIIGFLNSYEEEIYAIGKGPSATTVSASPKVTVYGDNVLVEGMVTDISPGTMDYRLTSRFPHGVAAVADENMSAWMEYVYLQYPRPSDVTGVEVVVSVLDPNNNIYEVGRTTSDDSGFFSCEFAPEVPGKYKVVATFEGSGAYYGSFAETAVSVKEAPAATPEPTPTPVSAADLYLVPGIAGIIVAIAVVGAILMLMLRKR